MDRAYIFNEATSSLCPECMEVVPAKIITIDNKVYIKKYCKVHGEIIELLEEDASYHKKKRIYDKPGTTMQCQREVNKGCPFDCGICPQHDQHGCIGLIEITTRCNLNCPLCYANAGIGKDLPLAKIEEMLDFFIDAENGSGEILQISGGEPTVHPNIIEILNLARSKNFKYVMLNTNGLRIAEDEEFLKELAKFKDRFEVYLQFDGFKEETYRKLRGKNLLEIKEKAINNLIKYKIPTTLVCTVTKDVNDDELGKIFAFALSKECIRGINLQPITYFGRVESQEKKHRITLSGVINRLVQQSAGVLLKDDFIPLPCNVERVALTYLYRNKKGSFLPITRNAKIENHLGMINNTFVFTVEDVLKQSGKSIKELNTTCECFNFIRDFREMIPFNFFLKSKEEKKEYIDMNTFRISVTSFIDAFNFDMKSIQKECVHVITEDLRKIPFSAYNMIHREEKNV